MLCDSACCARVSSAAAAGKAGDVEWEGVLEARCIRILDDREAVGREALEARWNIPSVRSHRVVDPSLNDVSRGQSAGGSSLKKLDSNGPSVVR